MAILAIAGCGDDKPKADSAQEQLAKKILKKMEKSEIKRKENLDRLQKNFEDNNKKLKAIEAMRAKKAAAKLAKENEKKQ